jgi:hypothetical protein
VPDARIDDGVLDVAEILVLRAAQLRALDGVEPQAGSLLADRTGERQLLLAVAPDLPGLHPGPAQLGHVVVVGPPRLG